MTHISKSTIGLLDTVALREPHPQLGLPAGAVGTVVERYDTEYVEVEFADLNGVAYAQATLPVRVLLALKYDIDRVAA